MPIGLFHFFVIALVREKSGNQYYIKLKHMILSVPIIVLITRIIKQLRDLLKMLTLGFLRMKKYFL